MITDEANVLSFQNKKLKIKLHVALVCRVGQRLLPRHWLGPVTHSVSTLGFPAAYLPSPLTAGFCGKKYTETQAHFATGKAHYFYYPQTFVHTRRDYILLKWPREILKNFLVTTCSAESYTKNYSWEALTNSGWILLKKFYLSCYTPKTNKQKKFNNIRKTLWLKIHFVIFSNYVISFVIMIRENLVHSWKTEVLDCASCLQLQKGSKSFSLLNNSEQSTFVLCKSIELHLPIFFLKGKQASDRF